MKSREAVRGGFACLVPDVAVLLCCAEELGADISARWTFSVTAWRQLPAIATTGVLV